MFHHVSVRHSLTLSPLFQKFGSNQSKPEFTVDLRGGSVDWASKDKSSKKHVIEVSLKIHHEVSLSVNLWFIHSLVMFFYFSSAENASGHRAADPVWDRQRHQRLVSGAHRDHQHTCKEMTGVIYLWILTFKDCFFFFPPDLKVFTWMENFIDKQKWLILTELQASTHCIFWGFFFVTTALIKQRPPVQTRELSTLSSY